MILEDGLGDPHREPTFTVLDEVRPLALSIIDFPHMAIAACKSHSLPDAKRHVAIIADGCLRITRGRPATTIAPLRIGTIRVALDCQDTFETPRWDCRCVLLGSSG